MTRILTAWVIVNLGICLVVATACYAAASAWPLLGLFLLMRELDVR